MIAHVNDPSNLRPTLATFFQITSRSFYQITILPIINLKLQTLEIGEPSPPIQITDPSNYRLSKLSTPLLIAFL